MCFALIACHLPGKRIVAIKRGETGYYGTTLDDVSLSLEQAKAIVDHYNRKLEVSEAQKNALLIGSMFGCDAPGAQPGGLPQ
jgi:hypothetical protein